MQNHGCDLSTSVFVTLPWDTKYNACSPLSFGDQVFGSDEAMNQTRPEPRAEEGEVQHSPSGTADAPQLPSWNPLSPGPSNQEPGSENRPLVTESAVGSETSQQSAEASEVLKEKTKTRPQPAGVDIMDPVAKDEVSKKQMETVSETQRVKGCNISKSQDTSESEEKSEVQEKDKANLLSDDSKAAETNVDLRSVPETTNVLKLETEIRNEYYQAPPLGQTLTFQARRSKSNLKVEPLCPPSAGQDHDSPSETMPEISEKSETIPDKTSSQMSKTCTTESERKVSGTCDLAETKRIPEIPPEKLGSNSPVRQVLNALQSLSSHSRQSPDTADSDDSPSALEMEDIPAGITCVTSEDFKARPLAGLATPPFSFAQREKMASADLVLDHHLDTACNTSPEGTDLGLSEEEPELENVLTEPESADLGGDTKHESSEEQTYSVRIKHRIQIYLFFLS